MDTLLFINKQKRYVFYKVKSQIGNLTKKLVACSKKDNESNKKQCKITKIFFPNLVQEKSKKKNFEKIHRMIKCIKIWLKGVHSHAIHPKRLFKCVLLSFQ